MSFFDSLTGNTPTDGDGSDIIDSSDLTFTDIPGQPKQVTPVDLSNISANSLTAFFTAGKNAVGVTSNQILNGVAAVGSALTATAGGLTKGSSTTKPGTSAAKSGTLFGLPIVMVVAAVIGLLIVFKAKR